ncbi:MAG: helix-turn-helix transcriptional regulator [Acutalibacteraceae bacterium]|nr:helix-turn-helix transcriptional regulator [Acutalibacteraceae bacterium]
MFLYGANPIISVIGVEHLHWESGTFDISPRNYSALAFRIKGDAEITVKNTKYVAGPNSVLYLPQNLEYKANYTDTELIVIHFITKNDDLIPEVYSAENIEDIYKLFLQARISWKYKNYGFTLKIMSTLYSILEKILENKAKMYMPLNFVNAVSDIVSNFKSSDISVSLICKNTGICETSFRALFKKYYAKTPIEFITDLRIDNAKNLISNGISVETAAYESGFNDPKYFARIVKKKLNCTPRELKYFGK